MSGGNGLVGFNGIQWSSCNGDQHNYESSNACSHPVCMNLICTICGEEVSNLHGLKLDYMNPGLRLSETEADRVRDVMTNDVLSNKKMILVLDLDETLLHSTINLTPEEKYLEDHIDSLQDVFKVDLGYSYTLFVKLRPFVRDFLKEASAMFEMYVYTKSNKEYARMVVSFLDPDGTYFGSRLISRLDSTTLGEKKLDVVMGQERAIVILDDRKSVWPVNKDNLIQVFKYKFFALSISGKRYKSESFAENQVDENAIIMQSYLEILRTIHSRFFDPDQLDKELASRDVRDVMRKIQGEILKGCKLALRSNHLTRKEKLGRLSEIAKKMGATCVSENDPSVTHVVTMNPIEPEDHDPRHQPLKKAKRETTYHPEWIKHSYKLWRRLPVEHYICKCS